MSVCIRRAWLTQEGESLELEDVEGGWACTLLDLGWPEVREVMNNRPDQDGADDMTKFFGARAVSADITTTGHAERVDEIAAQFGRFMYPGVRSQLHYVLDRDDNPERVLVVRPSGYQWPISGGRSRDISLSWIAADPIAHAAEATVCTAWAGPSTPGGRTYNWRPNRFYAGAGGARITGYPISKGEVPPDPILRIYGPITAPQVMLESWLSGKYVQGGQVKFEAGFTIPAGEWVEVDCRFHTARWEGDARRSCASSIMWTLTSWPVVMLPPASNMLNLLGSSTDALTQVQAIWRDGFLT